MQFTISTSRHQEMIDITDRVNDIVSQRGVKEGVCNVFALHATAAVVVNENWDPNIPEDCFKAWNKIIPEHAEYKHDKVDGNAQSHIIAAMLGPGETIPVREGKLLLGRWQSLMLVELDGPRSDRKVQVTVK